MPFSDGTYFSDGSGFAVSEDVQLRLELVDRLRETLARLRTIDRDELLRLCDNAGSNAAVVPTSHDIDNAIREVESGLEEMGGSVLGPQELTAWRDRLQPLGERLFTWSLGLAGKTIETFSIEVAKSAAGVVGPVGTAAVVLYACGQDVEGIRSTIVVLVSLLVAGKALK